MDLFSFSCGMCGELHNKYLPSTTNRTTCHKCGNLIEISHQRNIPSSNKRNHINFNNNRNNNIRRNNFFNDSDDDNSNLDNDFYDFNRYSRHNDYLNTNSQDDLSELNDNIFMDEFDRFYSGNILSNNQQSRPLQLSNTRYNFSNINLNQDSNRPFARLNQRSFSTNQSNNNNKITRTNNRHNIQNNNNNNRFNNNLNNNLNNGKFSIQIPNDNYDRYSALHHRSNFGYRGEDSLIHNFEDFDDSIMHEIEYDLERMSRRNDNNPLSRSIGLVGSLIVKPEKPKIKLEKIKMTKSLYTKNDGDKNEAPSCCICLAQMKINQEVTLLKCQHLFHFKCLDKWVENKEVCPFCRGKIEFAKIHKKGKDIKEDEKVESNKNNNTINSNSNLNILNKNISVRPVIGERKTNIIRANNSILNSSKINKKSKK